MITILAAHIHEFLFIVLSIFFIFAALRFFVPHLMPITLRVLAGMLLGVWVVYGSVLTFLQRAVWVADPSMKPFLALPIDGATPFPWWLLWMRPLFEYPGGAFAFFAWGHFWFAIVLSFMFAFLVYGVFFFIARKYQDRITKEDLLIVLITTLVVGWPRATMVVPLALILTVFFTILPALQKKPTPVWVFGSAFLLAAISAFFFGEQALRALDLYTLLRV